MRASVTLDDPAAKDRYTKVISATVLRFKKTFGARMKFQSGCILTEDTTVQETADLTSRYSGIFYASWKPKTRSVSLATNQFLGTEPRMPKNQVSDLITDQEIAFANLVLSGEMTDRRAAEAVGLNPETAAYTKGKPRVREYMIERRAALHEQRVQQETEELRRQNQSRERVLARLWNIADLAPEMTRNSMSAQIKALSMIVAIERMIPDRRTHSAQNRSTPPQTDTAESLREQQGKASGPQANPDLVPGQDAPGFPDPVPSAAADELSELGPNPGLSLDPSDPTLVHPVSPSGANPSSPQAPVEKKPDTWRLRL